MTWRYPVTISVAVLLIVVLFMLLVIIFCQIGNYAGKPNCFGLVENSTVTHSEQFRLLNPQIRELTFEPQEENTIYRLLGGGIAITVPENWQPVWRRMDENTSNYYRIQFPSFNPLEEETIPDKALQLNLLASKSPRAVPGDSPSLAQNGRFEIVQTWPLESELDDRRLYLSAYRDLEFEDSQEVQGLVALPKQYESGDIINDLYFQSKKYPDIPLLIHIEQGYAHGATFRKSHPLEFYTEHEQFQTIQDILNTLEYF